MAVAKKKSGLTRNLRLARALDRDGVVAHMGREERTLTGEVGLRLMWRMPGSIQFLDRRPRGSEWISLMCIGVYGGVVVSYGLVTEFVPMCSAYRNRLTGGVGKVRWARLRGRR